MELTGEGTSGFAKYESTRVERLILADVTLVAFSMT